MRKMITTIVSVSLLLVSCNDSKGKKTETVVSADKTGKDTTTGKDITKEEEHHVAGALFDIKTPAGWERLVKNYMGHDIVIIRSPKEDANDNFMENVNVVTDKVGNVDLDNYVNLNIENMEKGLTSFQKGEVTTRNINGNEFRVLAYSQVSAGVPIDADVYFTIRDGRAYAITCSAKGGNKGSYNAKFDEIVSSFKIL
jgi:hypothetical protein